MTRRPREASGPPHAVNAPDLRLAETLTQIRVCLDDADQLVLLGKQRFDDDWVVRRAAKNLVTEFAETANRLPEAFKAERPDIPWRAISGMRNRIVHVYENSDPETIWAVLQVELPKIRTSLDLGD